MRIEQIGSRGSLLTFDDEISVYLVSCMRFHLLCDTHLGPDSMDQVFLHLSNEIQPGQMIIFNSHSDWDHIWGNGAFPDSIIIAHETCRQRMLWRGEFDLTQNSALQRGRVVLTPPNLTFSEKLTFNDEEIGFSHAPGHTEDSSICYDHRDHVLYLGDLVEDPIPYLDAPDLDTYIRTLTRLLDHPARILVSAHSGIVTRDLILKNLEYIRAVRDNVPFSPDHLGTYQDVHQWNLNMRIVYRFEQAARKRLGERYSLLTLLEQAGDLHAISPRRLLAVLEEYISRSDEPG